MTALWCKNMELGRPKSCMRCATWLYVFTNASQMHLKMSYIKGRYWETHPQRWTDEISRDLRYFPRGKPEGNLIVWVKSRGQRGRISQYRLCFGVATILIRIWSLKKNVTGLKKVTCWQRLTISTASMPRRSYLTLTLLHLCLHCPPIAQSYYTTNCLRLQKETNHAPPPPHCSDLLRPYMSLLSALVSISKTQV